MPSDVSTKFIIETSSRDYNGWRTYAQKRARDAMKIRNEAERTDFISIKCLLIIFEWI